ncbi:MAG: 30S ribosomal protein S8 [Phycisphaerae bacterium]
MWSDPIADLLTRIRNAVRVGAKQVSIPHSRMKADICRVLKEEGYISGFDKIDDGKQGILRVDLKYGPHGEPVIRVIRRESKTGRRRYCGWTNVPRVLNQMGIAVVSTSRGVVSDRTCRREKIGGELICTLY